MKQIIQNLSSGATVIAEVPPPTSRNGNLLIRTSKSLVSAGTERMLLEFGKASLLEKARQQPERVKAVIGKARTDGIFAAYGAVKSKLDQPIPLGYCNVGVVMESNGLGNKIAFRPGDRVVSNGPHAEMVSVPHNLCARIPDSVTDEAATFVVVGAIGLQGIRLLNPTLGEKIVVYGLGLIGLLSVQLLIANGCEVLGIDVDPARLKLAESFGAKSVNAVRGSDVITATESWTEGKGIDAVLVTASAKSDEIMHNSASMCRRRGRIVLVGVVSMNLQRSDFYEKEISLQVSCSYGPGRYDQSYEIAGNDYPYGFVRWTEQRNFEAVLEMMRSGRLDTKALVSHRFEIAEALNAYEALANDSTSLGIVLDYPSTTAPNEKLVPSHSVKTDPIDVPIIGVIGAGNYARMTLMPALQKVGARISSVAALEGVDAAHLAKKYGAESATTDYHDILVDTSVKAVVVAVGHNLHAKLVCESLDAGKHVFVEKPLALNLAEVESILAASRRKPNLHVTVGFNRRFSPHVLRLKEALNGHSEPLAMTMTVNAGVIPPNHWVHDPVRGGGRIIGEACHFIDLMVFLSASKVLSVSAISMSNGVAVQEDKMSILLGFEDGSVGTINYFANGSKQYPKEMLEVFSEGRVARLDNFRVTRGYGFKNFKVVRTMRQDKGHLAQFKSYLDLLKHGGEPLVPLDQSINVTLASFAAMTSAHEGRSISLQNEYGVK